MCACVRACVCCRSMEGWQTPSQRSQRAWKQSPRRLRRAFGRRRRSRRSVRTKCEDHQPPAPLSGLLDFRCCCCCRCRCSTSRVSASRNRTQHKNPRTALPKKTHTHANTVTETHQMDAFLARAGTIKPAASSA